MTRDCELTGHFFICFLQLLLAVGTKLEHVITQLAQEVAEKHSAIEGDLVVNPSDDHFWFGRPKIVLYLIHFILFQNAFEIAFFFWILVSATKLHKTTEEPRLKAYCSFFSLSLTDYLRLQLLHHGPRPLHCAEARCGVICRPSVSLLIPFRTVQEPSMCLRLMMLALQGHHPAPMQLQHPASVRHCHAGACYYTFNESLTTVWGLWLFETWSELFFLVCKDGNLLQEGDLR